MNGLLHKMLALVVGTCLARMISKCCKKMCVKRKGGDSMGELNCIELKARRWSFRTDTYGFSALPAGYYYGNENKFYSLDVDACFWSSTATYYLSVLNGTFYSGKSNNGYSVRCLQDSN